MWRRGVHTGELLLAALLRRLGGAMPGEARERLAADAKALAGWALLTASALARSALEVFAFPSFYRG